MCFSFIFFYHYQTTSFFTSTLEKIQKWKISSRSSISQEFEPSTLVSLSGIISLLHTCTFPSMKMKPHQTLQPSNQYEHSFHDQIDIKDTFFLTHIKNPWCLYTKKHVQTDPIKGNKWTYHKRIQYKHFKKKTLKKKRKRKKKLLITHTKKRFLIINKQSNAEIHWNHLKHCACNVTHTYKCTYRDIHTHMYICICIYDDMGIIIQR